jgi:xylose isomerase
MATVNLFFDPVFRDGAFTANDANVRAYAVQKTMRAMDLGAELGAKIFVLWGGREGTETDAVRRPDVAVKRLREAVNYLCEYSIDRQYGFTFALEAKPNEPRGDIYMATTGAYLGFIPTLDHPEMVGVNPEGRARAHGRAQLPARRRTGLGSGEAGAHRSQRPGAGPLRPDFRFGSANVKAAFWLVKFLEDVGYAGPRHFDAHAYRTEDHEGVKDFAAGMHAHLPDLKERAKRWNADSEIQALVSEIGAREPVSYSRAHREYLLAATFDRAALVKKGLAYERLDQLTMEVLLGVR